MSQSGNIKKAKGLQIETTYCLKNRNWLKLLVDSGVRDSAHKTGIAFLKCTALPQFKLQEKCST